MATTQVMLVKPVEHLGGEGDEVKVKSGYARNYLLPQKLAVPVNVSNRKQIEALRRARDLREKKDLEAAHETAGRITKAHVAIAVKTGDGGRMFGAVTAADLQSRLLEEGVEIDRKQIGIYNPIKTLGRHTTRIKLHADVAIDFEFDIVSENAIVESDEK